MGSPSQDDEGVGSSQSPQSQLCRSSSPWDHWSSPWQCCRGSMVPAATCSHCYAQWEKQEKSPSPWNHWSSPWQCCRGTMVPAAAHSYCSPQREEEEKSPSAWNYSWTSARVCCRGPVVPATARPHRPHRLRDPAPSLLDSEHIKFMAYLDTLTVTIGFEIHLNEEQKK